jgi:6-pyruvoyltetrahydropterin/6-carboxytetrahydropterin synthase
MIEICKEWTFQAAHRLPNTPPDHKCHRLHGHTWTVRVWARGPVDPVLGWVVDYADLDELWREHCRDHLDHRILNDTIENPTTERLAVWIFRQLEPQIGALGCVIGSVEICEGGRNWTRFRPIHLAGATSSGSAG